MRSTLVLLCVLGCAAASYGCRPRADAFTKIQHPAVANAVEANEIQWGDGKPFGLPDKVFRSVASLTEMTQDQVCFEVILSGFDDPAAADLARAGLVLHVGGERFTPKVEQLVEPQEAEHLGKRTEYETVDTGLRENVCVDGVRNDRGEIVSCTKWQQNAITETHSYDVPQTYLVYQGAGQACFETKGMLAAADIDNVVLEVQNSKVERKGFWGPRVGKVRVRWDLLGDVPEIVGAKWGGFGGTELVKAIAPAPKAPPPPPEDDDEEEPKPPAKAPPPAGNGSSTGSGGSAGGGKKPPPKPKRPPR
jgi:hypothetical protein